MLTIISLALDDNPKQGFLGDLFMTLQLNDAEFSKQIFTPYYVADLICSLSYPQITTSWSSVADSTCGSGDMLIAAAHNYQKQGVNYQRDILFVGQDISLVAVCMCYIQLSLLGCSGYVVHGDIFDSPGLSENGSPLFPVHNESIWYTPFYFQKVWNFRRIEHVMRRFIK
jgi:Type I restriction-modification system methyltransferase subunit